MLKNLWSTEWIVKLKKNNFIYEQKKHQLSNDAWVSKILCHVKRIVLKSLLRKQNKNVQFPEKFKIFSENN